MSFSAADPDPAQMKLWYESIWEQFRDDRDRRISDRFGKFSHIAQATIPSDSDIAAPERSQSVDSEDCVIIEVPIPIVNLCTPDRVATPPPLGKRFQRRLPPRLTSMDNEDYVFMGVPDDIIDLCSPNENVTLQNDPGVELCSQYEVFSDQERRARRWSSDNIPDLECSNCYQQDGHMRKKHLICKICFKRH
ncbi:hypothetical protein RP20_CCG006519 [Aedes albopictus]|nr:hypothetical protein RP20_CCG006519 [Aedes albopictus]